MSAGGNLPGVGGSGGGRDLDLWRNTAFSESDMDLVTRVHETSMLCYIYTVLKINDRQSTAGIMADHRLYKAKMESVHKFTLAQSPLSFSVSCTLGANHLSRIRAQESGAVLTFDEMIDNFPEFHKDLQLQVASVYSTRRPEDTELNFCMTDLSITDIQAVDNAGSLTVAGSVVLPYLRCVSHPLNITDGTWRRVQDRDRPCAYVGGQRHSFIHTLKHQTVSNEYQLISLNSRTLDPVMYPNRQIVGTASSPIAFRSRPDQSLQVVQMAPPLLHGHLITNKTAYECEGLPVVSQYLRPGGPDSAMTTEYHTHLPVGSYQHSWFHLRPELQKENGSLVPLDEYTAACYDFLQQVNSNRATNFKQSGIWWNVQYLRENPCVKFTLKFRIVPIVENHPDNIESIPFSNLRQHLRGQMVHMDKFNLN